jgi:hypothetical protein
LVDNQSVHEVVEVVERAILCSDDATLRDSNEVYDASSNTRVMPSDEEMPRNYDREYTSSIGHRVRRRMGYSHSHGRVIRFVVQLEYELEGGEWATIVRSDHDPESEHGHDVTEEGVHLDVYRDSEKLRSEELFPSMEPSDALTYVEEHIAMHAERYIKRVEEWHEIRTQ